ncbi:MAG: DinB family protein [Acidobacteriaceae bacterium]
MTKTDNQDELRAQLRALLDGGNAHAELDEVVDDFPVEKRGVVWEAVPYSAWQLLEHLRIAQNDILQFSSNRDGNYKALKWPDEYWPKEANPPEEQAWERSLEQIRADRNRFEGLISDTNADLFAPFPWAGEGQNLLREALLIADHNAYHTGELVVLRRLLGIWPA